MTHVLINFYFQQVTASGTGKPKNRTACESIQKSITEEHSKINDTLSDSSDMVSLRQIELKEVIDKTCAKYSSSM